MNRISVLADWFHKGVLGGLDAARDVGAGAVQLYVGERGAVTDTWTPAFRKEVVKKLSDNGLVVSAMCGDLGGHGFQKPDEIDWRVEETRLMFDLARELGTDVVTSHIGVVPEDGAKPRRDIMLGAMKRLGEYGKAAGCRIAIETGPERPETLKAFLDDIASPFIGVNYDPANLVMVLDHVDPVKGVYTLKDHIFHCHVKDGKQLQYAGPERVYGFFAEGGIGDMRLEEYFVETALGDGDVDFVAWLKALDEIGYKGYFAIEREVGHDPTADIQKAVDFLRVHLA